MKWMRHLNYIDFMVEVYRIYLQENARFIYSVGYATLWLCGMFFLGKGLKELLCCHFHEYRRMHVNLWTIEFAAVGNQKSIETHDA